MWKENGKTTTLQLFLDSLSQKNMRDASSGDKLKIALFRELSLEEAMDLSRDRQILDLRDIPGPVSHDLHVSHRPVTSMGTFCNTAFLSIILMYRICRVIMW
jgi:hypothetical protein